jgi:hypothetical protein
MEQHGAGKVTVLPSPRFGVRIQFNLPRNPTRAQQAAAEARIHAANAACRRFLRPVQKDTTSSQDEAKFRDGMLAFARCMRRHGVNVPDPIIKRIAGGFDVSWGRTPGVIQGGARWRQAQRACRSLNPLEQPPKSG